LTDAARKLTGATNTSTAQVGYCDIQNFYPKANGPLNGTPVFLEQFGTLNEGDLDFHFRGIRPGPETLCIDPYTDNFLFPNDLELSFTALNTSASCRYKTAARVTKPSPKPVAPRVTPPAPSTPPEVSFGEDVSVGDATATLGVAASMVEADFEDLSGDSGGSSTSDGYSSPSGQALLSGLPENRTVTDGTANASVSATQTGPNSWTATVSISWALLPDPMNPKNVGQGHDGQAALWLKWENPVNRDGTQSVHVTAQADSTCKGGFISGANAMDMNGKITATGCPQPTSCQLSGAPPNFTFDSAGTVAGTVSASMNRGSYNDPGDSGSCTLTINIQTNR
jgi:hypothetical protein